MGRLDRRGFTLVELLVAILIFGIVSTAIYSLLTRTQRLSRTQAERSIMQANVRTGLALVTSELRELNARGSLTDIIAMSATAIQYRGMRGLGFICEVTASSVKLPRPAWSGYREPLAGRDLVMLFVENNPDLATDDGWTQRVIDGVGASTCTWATGTVQAVELTLATDLSTDTLAMMTLGSPARTFENMEIGVVTADGEDWLGARSISGGEGTLQPVLGPLAPNGVNFTYWPGVAEVGVETGTASAVRTIQLRLIGRTENIVAAGAGTTAWQRAVDTLITDIRLRNAP
jgi:prepilin-type N-terminal cleavage/methylation domain-containing protein